jgi:predicted alpha/beta-hydrolase family hydrolase
MPPPFQLHIDELDLSVSALVDKPATPDYALSLAHGAGAPMTHPFMEGLATELANQGILTIRFNFPYMELGRRSPGSPKQAQAAIRTVIEFLDGEIGNLPVFIGGKSYGGRMSSELVSSESDLPVTGLIFYGFPLHAPGRPGKDRGDHLKSIGKPMLFLQGTRDNLAEKDLMDEVVKSLSNAKLVWFEDANHSFKVPKRAGISPDEMLASLARQTRQFMDS